MYYKHLLNVHFFCSNSVKCPGNATKSSPIKTTMLATISGKNSGFRRTYDYSAHNLLLECSHHTQITNDESCFCKKYKMYHTYHFDEQVPLNIQALLGTYEKQESSKGNDIIKRTFKQKDKDLYLFRIHPNDRIWSIGPGLAIDHAPLARIDFHSYDANWCPNRNDISKGLNWEVFDPVTQLWSHNTNIKVECIECPKNFFICPTSGKCGSSL